jgi:hypothetical protein
MTPKKDPKDLLKRGRKPRNVTLTGKPPLPVTPNPPLSNQSIPPADSSGGNSDESFTVKPAIIAIDDKGGIIPVNTDKEKADNPAISDKETTLNPVKPVKEVSALQLAMNKAMIGTGIMVYNKMIVGITNIPNMAFDDDETEQLCDLWSPFLPEVSPLTNAIIGTVIIVGGKVGVYMVDKRKNKKKEEANGKSDFNDRLIKEKQDEVPADIPRS